MSRLIVRDVTVDSVDKARHWLGMIRNFHNLKGGSCLPIARDYEDQIADAGPGPAKVFDGLLLDWSGSPEDLVKICILLGGSNDTSTITESVTV